MTDKCERCASRLIRVIESRLLGNNTRRRRHQCEACAHRWTTWDGDRPRPGRVANARTGNGFLPPLTEDQVRLVLTSPLSGGKLAIEIGRSKEAINAIRRGVLHAKVLPELPRRQRRQPATDDIFCHRCAHWRGTECGIGFPDPIDEGPGFAADCALYEPVATV